MLIKYTPALVADWANGIFAVLLAAWLTDTQVIWWYFIIGIVVSHFPDIDAVPELIQRRKVSASSEHPYDHRSFLHYPIISLSIAGLLWIFVGFWGLVTLFAFLLHLINDLYGTGWGIKIFWPINRHSFKVLGRRVNRMKYLLKSDGSWDTLSEDDRRLRLIVKWSDNELPECIRQWGIDDWVIITYYRINGISVTEYLLFTSAITLALLSLLT